MASNLSPAMIEALTTAARDGQINFYRVLTGTAVALISRDVLEPMTVTDEGDKVHRITENGLRVAVELGLIEADPVAAQPAEHAHTLTCGCHDTTPAERGAKMREQARESRQRHDAMLAYRLVADAERVARRDNPAELGKVIGVVGDGPAPARVIVAWGEHAELVPHFAIAGSTHENVADLIPVDRRSGAAAEPAAPALAEVSAEVSAADLAPILLPRPDGTAATIEADAIRALVGYVEQRDGWEDDLPAYNEVAVDQPAPASVPRVTAEPTLLEMITQYGDLRASVMVESECGSPAEADEIANQAAALLERIRERLDAVPLGEVSPVTLEPIPCAATTGRLPGRTDDQSTHDALLVIASRGTVATESLPAGLVGRLIGVGMAQAADSAGATLELTEAGERAAGAVRARMAVATG